MFTPRLDIGRPIAKHPLNDGLVSRWQVINQGPFMGSGYLYDLAGNNNGLLTNDPTWTGPLGRPGGFGALRFDAVDDYVSFNSPEIGTGDFALACWVRSRFTDSNQVVLNLRRGDPVYLELWAGEFGGGGYNWKAYSGTYTGVHIDSGVLAGSEWTHLCLSRVAGTNTLYVNGLPKGTYANSESIDSGTGYIGAREPSITTWGGNIDDVRIWAGRGLSDSDAFGVHESSRQQYDPTLNWIRPRKYFFVDGGGGGVTMPIFYHHYTQQGIL